jgi:hypothetical protein
MSVRDIKSEKRVRRVRKISGRVDVSGGVPSVGAGSGFTLVDGGAGRVTVTLSLPGKVLLSAHAIPIEATAATGFSAKVLGYTNAASVEFGIYQADGTDGVLVDNVGFFFEITVKDVTN